jgi:glutathione-regulated potassium-efflux system ancillary protein KefC
MHHGEMLTTIFVLLLASIIFVPITKKFGLSSILGYLLAGMVIGPSALNLVQNVESIAQISEFGVILFMFLIGLELRPSILQEFKKDIFNYGISQVVITGSVFAIISWYTTQNLVLSVLIGMSFALSSTALGVQILQEKNLLKTKPGKSSLAILLFQDIAIVPMMAIITLAGALVAGAQASSLFNVANILKMFFATFFTIVIGKYFLKYVFRFVATLHLREVFTAVSLLLIIGISMLMESVGLSMAFGSFLAGILMADSEFRFELEINIEPFKGLLMGLFFMAVGMGMDLALFFNRPVDIIGLAAVITIIKCSVLFLISSMFKLNFHERMIFTIATSQIGEFSFVLLKLGVSQGIMVQEQSNIFSIVIALSMATTPILFLLYEKFIRNSTQGVKAENTDKIDSTNPVIIAGFGRFGTTVARILHANNIGTTILDNDPNQIELVRKFGFKAYYGDISRIDLLEAAGGNTAKSLVITVDEMQIAEETIQRVKQHFPHLKIFVRCHSHNDYFNFKALGADVLIRDTFSCAMEMSGEVLKTMGFSSIETVRILKHFKLHDTKYLEDSFLYFKQEEQLVGLSKKARFELERTLKNDQKWISENKRFWD